MSTLRRTRPAAWFAWSAAISVVAWGMLGLGFLLGWWLT